MDARHARYPFLAAARAAVDDAGEHLATVVAEEEPVVERGLERVEWALTEGDVGERHDLDRVEVLSYPVARVLVSLVNEHVCTRKYARAEAATARERFTTEFRQGAPPSSVADARLTHEDLLAEFDVAGAVREAGDGTFEVDVATYLDLAADRYGDEWRLVNRRLRDGVVPVTRDELHALFGEAVRQRVERDLPFDVPDEIADEVTDEVEQLRGVLADLDLTRDIDTVVPELFPPCMQHLLDAVQRGEHLAHHSRFAIASFLTSIGMTTDEIVDLFQVNPGFGEDATRYQVDHIRGETSPTQYSPPSCATMQSYGDCVDPDDRCDRISHPMAYYEGALDDADEDEVTDWRENADADANAEADADADA